VSFELNPQQNDARKRGTEWLRKANSQVFEISGPAGSGKTTIVDEIVTAMNLKNEEVLFMAYVGKATMALALRGNFAKTIHSTIYDLVQVPRLDSEGIPIEKNGRVVTMPTFEKKDSLPEGIKLLVVDEGGMLNKQIAEDVLSFGLPVLVLGDLNQLPPVFGESYFLKKPDVVLTQIMRQSEGNPIIWLSQQAINGRKIEYGKYGDLCYVIPQDMIDDNLLKNSDIIICGKNETRQNINAYYRQNIMGVKSKTIMYGDKIVCRQNNWKKSIANESIYLINGMIGYVEHIYLDTYNGKSICIDFRPEFMEETCFEKIRIDYDYLFQPLTEKSGMSYYNKFQFGRAITCHLAQGSQYDKVLVYKERLGSWTYQRKWDYTAITRAVNGLVIAM
jgi:exodeoxyribonuclease V